MNDEAILSSRTRSSPEDGDVWALIEAMRRGVTAAPQIYRPGEFWNGLIQVNLEMLRSGGIANFKRTVSNNYYNWLVTTLRDPQVRNALRQWLHRPSIAPLLDRIEAPVAGLRTLDRSQTYALSRFAAWRYKCFVGELWEIAARNDPLGLTGRLSEPEVGNPIRIRRGDRLISQDLANSIIEFGFISASGVVGDGSRVAELGAGYGRLAYVFANAHRLIYCIFDIPPALAVAQWYLAAVLGADRVRPYAPLADFADVEAELTPGTVAFFTPDQLELFPDGWFDCTQTISTLPEMPAAQGRHFVSLLTAKSRTGVFLKQWRQWRNPADDVELTEADYVLPPPWRLAARRVDLIQPAFFNQLWLRGAEPATETP